MEKRNLILDWGKIKFEIWAKFEHLLVIRFCEMIDNMTFVLDVLNIGRLDWSFFCLLSDILHLHF